jgi:small subunit ribosomal protein S17e
MGRIGTVYISRIAQKLLEKSPDNFSKDFKKNKEGLAKMAEIPSKKLRNKIAGKLVRLAKEAAKE